MLAELRGVRDFALGCLLVDAGLRVSEACGLTCGDVALVEGVLHVRGQLAPLKPGEAPRIVPPKSERGVRTVPLLPRLQAALEALYAGEDDSRFVLHTRRGTPLSRHNARRSIRERDGRRGRRSRRHVSQRPPPLRLRAEGQGQEATRFDAAPDRSLRDSRVQGSDHGPIAARASRDRCRISATS